MTILGKHNPRVKSLLRLTRRRFREQEGKFIAEGPDLVAEALSSGWPVEAVYCTARFAAAGRGEKVLDVARERGVAVYELAPEVFGRAAATETPQGVLAVVQKQEAGLTDLLRGAPPLVVVADGLQDPGNLGTVIRTAYAAGASGALLLTGTVDLYNSKTIRATAGAVFHFPVVQNVPWEEAHSFLQQAGLKLVVADPHGETPFYAADLIGSAALIIGSEGAGPRAEVREAAAQHVFIPMPGGAESLNAAVAAALLIYEAVRRRQGF